VVLQVALALVLLIGSRLMIRTFSTLRHVDPGFTGASELETIRVTIPDSQLSDPERIIRMEEAILYKIEGSASSSTTGS
jgi:hypothetical protein